MVKGKLHSIETMGLVDGPGIRTVFFLQGCSLKCQYCHNPDSQGCSTDKTITPEEVLETALRYKAYYRRSGGGVTFSGGEPLLQGEFLVKTLKLLKKNGIHTTIDTCGVGDTKYYEDILKHVDLIMLDLKHWTPEGYKELTGRSIDAFEKFVRYLENYNKKIIIRHVMVPTRTDDMDSIHGLLGKVSTLANKIDKIEILPYHRMGVQKYKDLNMPYELEGIPAMDKTKAKEYEKYINEALDIMKAKYAEKII